MRTIKARYWDKENERMLYAYEPDENEQGKREYYPLAVGIGFSHWDKNQLSEPMLFTGLSDKQGKEIYKGDLVKFDNDALWEVIYKAPRFELVNVKTKETIYFLESKVSIIGNIYENKDLLK